MTVKFSDDRVTAAIIHMLKYSAERRGHCTRDESHIIAALMEMRDVLNDAFKWLYNENGDARDRVAFAAALAMMTMPGNADASQMSGVIGMVNKLVAESADVDGSKLMLSAHHQYERAAKGTCAHLHHEDEESPFVDEDDAFAKFLASLESLGETARNDGDEGRGLGDAVHAKIADALKNGRVQVVDVGNGDAVGEAFDKIFKALGLMGSKSPTADRTNGAAP